MQPRFALRDVLIAVAWLSVCFASWTYLGQNADWVQSHGFPAFHARFEGCASLLALGGGFVAWSALRGDHKLGMQWGLLTLAALVLALVGK